VITGYAHRRRRRRLLGLRLQSIPPRLSVVVVLAHASTVIQALDSLKETGTTDMGKQITNERLVLAERPARGPVTDKTFRREKVEVQPLKDGEVLVKVEYSAIVSVRCFVMPRLARRG